VPLILFFLQTGQRLFGVLCRPEHSAANLNNIPGLCFRLLKAAEQKADLCKKLCGFLLGPPEGARGFALKKSSNISVIYLYFSINKELQFHCITI
jgi:hypothetical protein